MTDNFLPIPENPGRVLVVDHTQEALLELVHQLNGHPFTLTTSLSAEKALELCDTLPFEAILTQNTMPGMDGLMFCRRLRETQNARTPLVIASSHDEGEAWVSKALDAGALDHLAKPYVLPELVAKLRVMVRLTRQQVALSLSERHQALLEVTGGAAHELSQPLAAAKLLIDLIERQQGHPTSEQMAQLREFVNRTAVILNQIRGLRIYVTKPYPASGPILDLERSREISGAHEAQSKAKDAGSE